MIYVFPHCAAKEKEIEKIQGISRLFAFPKKPTFKNNGRITILDSGAFGLSMHKRKMNLVYMKKLSSHYEKFAGNNTLCIAPDEFGNPMQTIWNFKKWLNNGFYKNITPVIQPFERKKVNLDDYKRQAEFYINYSKTICISNWGFYAYDAKTYKIDRFVQYLRSLGFEWIHCLGAGWSLDDVKEWQEIGTDSIDSIAYYLKEKNGFGSSDVVQNIYKIREILKF